MIKRIRCATKKTGASGSGFAAALRHAVGLAADAPPDVRPVRIAVCIALPDLTGSQSQHDGIGLEWFADVERLDRFHSWLETPDGVALTHHIDGVVTRDTSPVVVADEVVLRGAGWLEQRWRDGGEQLKHMAMARRAANLTAAQFSERWRNHAGRIGRSGAAEITVIPDEARGCAYVQNHPRARAKGEWAYDAVNEVYCDDIASLQRRIAWFRGNLDRTDEDLVGESWFIAAREEVLFTSV